MITRLCIFFNQISLRPRSRSRRVLGLFVNDTVVGFLLVNARAAVKLGLLFQNRNFGSCRGEQRFRLGKLLLERRDVVALPGAVSSLVLAHSIQSVLGGDAGASAFGRCGRVGCVAW